MAFAMFAGFRAWAVAALVILVWGMTFANTRALLGDFSALEILVGRFALAWAALWPTMYFISATSSSRGETLPQDAQSPAHPVCSQP